MGAVQLQPCLGACGHFRDAPLVTSRSQAEHCRWNIAGKGSGIKGSQDRKRKTHIQQPRCVQTPVRCDVCCCYKLQLRQGRRSESDRSRLHSLLYFWIPHTSLKTVWLYVFPTHRDRLLNPCLLQMYSFFLPGTRCKLQTLPESLSLQHCSCD